LSLGVVKYAIGPKVSAVIPRRFDFENGSFSYFCVNNILYKLAYQALKFCKDIDGDKAISLVEPYMQLSQSCLGLKQFSKAEEYLSLARWIVLNTPTCSDKIKTRLHMLKGRVAISQGKRVTNGRTSLN
jgi:hypothetical protein